MEELKSKFIINKDYIDVDKSFISKYHLTSYDLRELISILYEGQKTTINTKIVTLFKKFKIDFIPEGIGWRIV